MMDMLCRKESCEAANNFTMCPMCMVHCGYWSYHYNCVYAKLTRAVDNVLMCVMALFISLWGQYCTSCVVSVLPAVLVTVVSAGYHLNTAGQHRTTPSHGGIWTSI